MGRLVFIGAIFILSAVQALFALDKVDTADFLKDYEFPKDDPIIASAKSQLVAAKSPRFRKVETSTSFGDLPANCLLQEYKSAFVLVLPGITSSRYSESNLAQAQKYFNAGRSVCVFSNSFRPEFFDDYGIVPGDLKAEADLFWQATESLLRQLSQKILRVDFVGLSYGTHLLKEVLLKASSPWSTANPQDFGNVTLGRAVFISPPYSLLNSIHELDQLWHQKSPSLIGIGTLPLFQISLDMLGYGRRNEPMPTDYSADVYQAFLLKVGFYGGMQAVAERFSKDPSPQHRPTSFTASQRQEIKENSTKFDFKDYIHFIYQPLLHRDVYSPHFDDEWNQISMPALVIHSEDDYINSTSDIENLKSLPKVKSNIEVLSVPRGSHLGFLGLKKVEDVVLQYLN